MTKNGFNNLTAKIIENKLILAFGIIYGFVWSICKVVFGVFTQSYFFCVSGASSLLFVFIKHIYLKNFKNEDMQEKQGKSITIAILLMVSGVLFTIYMARLFYIDDVQKYGTIWSITIATASFVELGLSIYNLKKASKTNDILLQSFRACNLASSCFAIVLTQVALLSATNTPANFYNALTGVVLGGFVIMIGIIMLTKSCKHKNNVMK